MELYLFIIEDLYSILISCLHPYTAYCLIDIIQCNNFNGKNNL